VSEPRLADIGASGRNDRFASAAASFADMAALPTSELFRRLKSSSGGLRSTDAADILAETGPNRIDRGRRKAPLAAFIQRFTNPLVLILLFAASVSASTGDMASFVIIAVIVLVSVILDVLQEHQAQNAADKLASQVSLTAKVLRDGKESEIGTAGIVPGDVVLLTAGDLIPADARLIESRDLYVNEALLTGEAYPVEKNPLSSPAASPDRVFPSNVVFMGGSVVSGTAKALIVATGRATQLGSIASTLRRAPPPTAFALGIRDFGMMIIRATVFLVLFVLLVNLLFQRPLLESFLFALALAVGLTPELLPMIVSVTLSHGAMRMARKQVIVKRQSAIDDLGSMDVFCSDKTGTLTEAKIALVGEADLEGGASSDVLKMALLNARFETGLKSPLDEAILAASKLDLSAWRKIDEVPFDFERRRVSVLVEGEGRRLLIVKGAPEDVLRLAASYQKQGTSALPLDTVARQKAEETFRALGEDGYRALGVAWREVEADRQSAHAGDEKDLTFAGFLAFVDPPKPGAREALGELKKLGIAVKIITGDNEQVTQHVCRELGLSVSGTLLGSELPHLSDEAFAARIEDTTLFCRITPPQKSRIIAALRRRGHVVGYLGDGINDAPPLHAADVGFSVDTAVDVAKEAAAILLLRKELSVLAEGVREGRRTFANILKYMMMGTSSNFGNMFSMAAGVLFLPFLPMLPTQILLNNLLYDLSETTIPLDTVSETAVARPRRWDIGTVRRFMLLFGPVSSVFDLATFALLLWVFRAGPVLFHTGWFIESLATQILVIFIIRTEQPLRDWPHPALAASSLIALALAVALTYSPLAHWFGFVPLPVSVMGALAGITFSYLLTVFAVKRWLFGGQNMM